jgi:hypothetical protein
MLCTAGRITPDKVLPYARQLIAWTTQSDVEPKSARDMGEDR